MRAELGDQTLEKMEILLVEDEGVARHSIAQRLQRSGVRVITASDDISGLQLFQERASSISAVITDMRLRGSSATDHSGGEMAIKLKAMKPDLPVYCNSAIDVSEQFPFFEEYFIKGRKIEDSILSHIPDIIDKAEKFEQARFSKTPDALLSLKLKYGITDADFFDLVGSRRMPEMEKTALLLFHHAAENAREIEIGKRDEDDHDEADILVLEPGSEVAREAGIQRPIPIVLQHSDEIWIAELFGFPLIYTYADSKDEAINYLLKYLRQSYESHFQKKDGDKHWPHDMIHFGTFLKSVFGNDQ